MKRIFRPDNFRTVPDGTVLSAFLNPFLDPEDSTNHDGVTGLPAGVSVAAGRIGAGSRSWIHTHPVVTQVTYVVAGALTVMMKDRHQPDPYRLLVAEGSAVVSEPGSLLQLCNETAAGVEVLYIVSPAYVFEAGPNDEVIYDDAIVVAEDWESLAPGDWDAWCSDAARATAQSRRSQALERLAARRRETDR